MKKYLFGYVGKEVSMKNITVTVKNSFLNGVKEVFDCRDLDITDLEEVQYCIDECCGIYLDKHLDKILKMFPTISPEIVAMECDYILEEGAI